MRWRIDWYSIALGAGLAVVGLVLAPLVIDKLRSMSRWELAGVGLAALVLGWFAAGMIALEFVPRPTKRWIQWLQEWPGEPGNGVRLTLWIGATLLAAITLISPTLPVLESLKVLPDSCPNGIPQEKPYDL